MNLSIDLFDCKNPTEQLETITKVLFENNYKREARIYSVILAKTQQTENHTLDISYKTVAAAFLELAGEQPPTEKEFMNAISNLKKIKVRFYDHTKRLRTTPLIS